MSQYAYDPAFAPPRQAETFVPPVGAPPPAPESSAPPRMSITPGEGGLGVMFAALAKAQLNFKPIKADTSVRVDTKEKGSYTFAYAPLENVLAACVPALNAEGFFFSQPLYSAADGEGYVLRTCLMHASGGMIEVQTYIPKPAGRIQDLGSAITYQRRYVAQALFGVNSEDDDDGAQASGDKRTPVQRAPQPSAQPQQRPAQNGSPAAAPKATTTPPAATSAAPVSQTQPAASPATSAPAAEPAPETTLVREMTTEQRDEIVALFARLVPRLSAPMRNTVAVDVTGRGGADQMDYNDAEKLKAHLQERIAKQGAAS